MITEYDKYNREERYVCAHLFRLLHEPADNYKALREFLKTDTQLSDPRIYCEVALVRDAYSTRGDMRPQFMDSLVALVAAQERVTRYTPYTQLENPEWCTPSATHPRQICHKAAGKLAPEDVAVYGAVQAMFNAKPDLAICFDLHLVVYEAKLTTPFDKEQITRTDKIANVWAQLLYEDLGFSGVPSVEVRKLGREGTTADTTWEDVCKIARDAYSLRSDRTLQALESALRLRVWPGNSGNMLG